MKNFLKPILEFTPLVVFFLINANFGIYKATLAFMIASTISIPIIWITEKKAPIMPIVTSIFIIFFGGLTLLLQDEKFIKLKPTIINLIFAVILLVGLYYKKLFIKIIMGKVFEMSNSGWKKLTIRWALFFVFLAVLNEIVWRTQTTDFWVAFKVFGLLPITMLFAITQLPLINKETKSKN